MRFRLSMARSCGNVSVIAYWEALGQCCQVSQISMDGIDKLFGNAIQGKRRGQRHLPYRSRTSVVLGKFPFNCHRSEPISGAGEPDLPALQICQARWISIGPLLHRLVTALL